MTTRLISAAILAVAAMTSVAASAQTFNSFVFDQMNAPSARTRAEVKAEAVQAPAATTTSYGALEQPKQEAAPRAVKTSAPQAAAEVVKATQQ